jgi:hypothetical protein
MPLSRKGAEWEAQASEKVDQAKDKANELANDAKKKGEGRKLLIDRKQRKFYFIFVFRMET